MVSRGPATSPAFHACQREWLARLVSRPAGPWERATVPPAWASWGNNVAFVAQGSQAAGGGGRVGTLAGGGFELGCSEAAQTFSLPLGADFRPALRPRGWGGGGRGQSTEPPPSAGSGGQRARALCIENHLPPMGPDVVTEPLSFLICKMGTTPLSQRTTAIKRDKISKASGMTPGTFSSFLLGNEFSSTTE